MTRYVMRYRDEDGAQRLLEFPDIRSMMKWAEYLLQNNCFELTIGKVDRDEA